MRIPAARAVYSGSEFRARLGWGKDRFRAAVQAGRFRHLVAVNVSQGRRLVYVRSAVEAFISETPCTSLHDALGRPSRQSRGAA